MQQARAPFRVDFSNDAVLDLEGVRSRGDRKAVFNVIRKLEYLGPDLANPHVKSLKGEADLFELRPKQGACAVRLVFARMGRRFLVLSVAAGKSDLEKAIRSARRRLDRALHADN